MNREERGGKWEVGGAWVLGVRVGFAIEVFFAKKGLGGREGKSVCWDWDYEIDDDDGIVDLNMEKILKFEGGKEGWLYDYWRIIGDS